jgi:LmeA-like phospholipid-binding
VTEVYRRPRKRWGRRLLIAVIVLLVIIATLLVVADRLGASYAERKISDRVAQQVADQGATSEKPDVTVEGVPFLTQVLAGRYQEIRIGLKNFSGPAGNGRTIRMPLLDIRAKDVRAPLETLRTRRGNIVATTVTGTGTVDYATVADLTGKQGVKLGEKDGKLAVTAPVTILDQRVTVNGTANLTVRDDVVSVRFDQVTAASLPNVPLVQNLLNNYARQISLDVKLPALPLKLAVQKVQPTADGLVVTAGADEVQLNAGGL